MTGWNENDFLDKLTPLLRRSVAADPCPEPEAFSTVADDESDKILKNEVAAHIARCPTCRDLHERIQRFDGPIIPPQDTEWEQTEKRLGNWLEGFLASGTARNYAPVATRTPRLHDRWSRLIGASIGRPMRWILVPAATLALMIGSFFAGRLYDARPRQIADELASPKKPIPPQETLENRDALPPRRNPAGTSGTSPSLSNRKRTASPGPVGAETTAVMVPSPSEVAGGPISTPLEPPQNPIPPPTLDAPQSPVVTDEHQAQATPMSVPSIPPEFTRSNTAAVRRPPAPAATRSILAGGVATRSVTSAVARPSEAVPATSPVFSAPSAFRLDPGTRVWITLRSVEPRPDGVSAFRGLVLLPVAQSGATVVSRNAEVSGTMTTKNGKRSVQILEFLFAGAHYKVRGADGEANLRLLGAGEVVEFDAGRVLETWMASATTYEKLAPE